MDENLAASDSGVTAILALAFSGILGDSPQSSGNSSFGF
jgi:hypothetical protein